MSNGIFMITGDGSLLPMDQTPFPEEGSFQRLLETYPELLSGELVNPTNPRRWVLVKREVGISDGTITARWSLDHLFLDQDGIPTLVEVKRGENDDIRRKVVGQILDYAANVVSHWPPGSIRARFEDRIRQKNQDPAQELESRLGISPDVSDRFWDDVDANLRNKNIRMMIVADLIPRELRRIVEFLNEQMSPATFLALELKHFERNDIKTLVPVVFGQTEHALLEKATQPRGGARSVPDVVSVIKLEVGEDVANVVDEVLLLAKEQGFNIRPTGVSLYVGVPHGDGKCSEPFAFSCDKSGPKIWAQLGGAFLKPPLNTPKFKEEIRRRLDAIPGIALSKAPQYPNCALDDLSRESTMGFMDLLNWLRQAIAQPETAANERQ